MAKYVTPGDSIECNGAEIISRVISPSSFIEIIPIGKCKTYKCKRNSEATINRVLDPLIPIHKETSNVDLEDMLEGENILLAVYYKKNLKISVDNHTHSHRAQKTYTDCYTFAEITLQCKGNPSTRQLQENLQ